MTSTKPDLESFTTPLVHLYRGELGRMTSYRIRLDTTTNWAVGMNAAILSLALSDGALSMAAVFPVALLLNGIFLWMEARRYRGFELIRARVRLLELGLYARELGSTQVPEDWIEQLRESLESPNPPLSYLGALSVRLRRSYVWLIGLNYLAWGLMISRAGIEGARVGAMPGIAMLIFAGLLVPALMGLLRAQAAPEEG